TLFGADFRTDEVIGRSHRILALIESELHGRSFLLGDNPVIADVALYIYIANAPEGNVDISAYPSVRACLVCSNITGSFWAPFG
ncbi:hypothetical protein ACC739_37455, partial [Rhizobium ruizarguesonis]